MCRRFNHRRIAGFAAEELPADEIRTFAGNKKTPSWVFVTIEVWSRLWPSTVTGRRSYRNTHALFRDLSRRMNFRRVVSKNTNELKTCISRSVSDRRTYACLVLPPLSVGEMTLRLYGALNYSQNSVRDLRCALNGA